MLLVGLRLLELDEVAAHFPTSPLWQFLGYHSSHIPWVGCSLNDLIHPSFCFLTGASLVFSVAGRAGKGASKRTLWAHALRRSVILIALGIMLRSIGHHGIHWTFEETLTQTGLGYPVVFLLVFASTRVRIASFVTLLVGYWLFYVCSPILPPHANPAAWNIRPDWQHDFEGFYAHWNSNRNAGWSFDLWLLNLFPRPRPYVGYLGGYTTLNFIPTIATMILGLLAGTWLKYQPTTAIKRFVLAGVVCLALSLALHLGGICPIVKRLWTPAWVFFSGGCCFLILAATYHFVDVKQHRRWAFPLIVIGMNSLAMYLMRHLLDAPLEKLMTRHCAPLLHLFRPELQPVVIGSISLALMWLLLLWLHRRKLYLRV